MRNSALIFKLVSFPFLAKITQQATITSEQGDSNILLTALTRPKEANNIQSEAGN